MNNLLLTSGGILDLKGVTFSIFFNQDIDEIIPSVSELPLATLLFVGQQYMVTHFHWHPTYRLVIQISVSRQLL